MWPHPPETGQPLFIHVPKNGGTTVRQTFHPHLWSAHHNPARDVKEKFAGAWAAAPLRFAIIRNPWDRMVSWFYYRARHRDLSSGAYDPANVRASFREFLDSGDPENLLLYRNRCPRRLLCDDKDGLLVDRVYRFEDGMESIVADVARRTKLTPHPLRIHNKGGLRPATHYREFYDDYTRGLVAGRAAWEISLFGYEF